MEKTYMLRMTTYMSIAERSIQRTTGMLHNTMGVFTDAMLLDLFSISAFDDNMDPREVADLVYTAIVAHVTHAVGHQEHILEAGMAIVGSLRTFMRTKHPNETVFPILYEKGTMIYKTLPKGPTHE